MTAVFRELPEDARDVLALTSTVTQMAGVGGLASKATPGETAAEQPADVFVHKIQEAFNWKLLKKPLSAHQMPLPVQWSLQTQRREKV